MAAQISSMRWPQWLAALMLSAARPARRQDRDDVDRASNDRTSAQSDLVAGKAQFREANYGLAEKHFRKAVELRADNAEAWMGLAASYDELGRFDFADRAYDQLLKVAGRKPQILNNMGYSQLLRGNKKKARVLLIEAKQRHGRPDGGRRQSGAAEEGLSESAFASDAAMPRGSIGKIELTSDLSARLATHHTLRSVSVACDCSIGQ